MTFEGLLHLVERGMRMSHVYQPVMIRTLLDAGGTASAEQIARALLWFHFLVLEHRVAGVKIRRRFTAFASVAYLGIVLWAPRWQPEAPA
jgi:hypothetical protein